jgi:2',3'-cyclic-nucleotide 2'-phosphodiesterase (5'-nucleotidase family)
MSKINTLFYSLILLASLSFNSNVFGQEAVKATSPTYQITSSQHKIDSNIIEDKAINDMLAPYAENVKKQMASTIGQAKETINKEGPGAGRLGMLITDIIRQQSAKASGHKVDLAFQNNGGLRAEIPAGEITIGTIYRLMPFDNELAIVELSGTDVTELFESMGSSIKDFGAAISGAELTFQDKKLVKAKIDGKDVDPKATYTLALTDYLYKGGGEYPTLRKGKNYKIVGLLLRDAIINYIKSEQAENRPIVTPTNPRITLVNAQTQ